MKNKSALMEKLKTKGLLGQGGYRVVSFKTKDQMNSTTKNSTPRHWWAQKPSVCPADNNHWLIKAKSPHMEGMTQLVCEINGPWKQSNYAANAALIVKAVNEYDALVAVAEAAKRACEMFSKHMQPEDKQAAMERLAVALGNYKG